MNWTTWTQNMCNKKIIIKKILQSKIYSKLQLVKIFSITFTNFYNQIHSQDKTRQKEKKSQYTHCIHYKHTHLLYKTVNMWQYKTWRSFKLHTLKHVTAMKAKASVVQNKTMLLYKWYKTAECRCQLVTKTGTNKNPRAFKSLANFTLGFALALVSLTQKYY